jgi:hypothetical protein
MDRSRVQRRRFRRPTRLHQITLNCHPAVDSNIVQNIRIQSQKKRRKLVAGLKSGAMTIPFKDCKFHISSLLINVKPWNNEGRERAFFQFHIQTEVGTSRLAAGGTPPGVEIVSVIDCFESLQVESTNLGAARQA